MEKDYRLSLEWALNELGYYPNIEPSSFGGEKPLYSEAPLHSPDIITVPQHEIENPFNPAKHFLLKMETLDVSARSIDVKVDGIPDTHHILPLLKKDEEVVALFPDDPHTPKGTSGRYYEVALLTPNGWWTKQGITGTPGEMDFKSTCDEWGPPILFAIRKKAP